MSLKKYIIIKNFLFKNTKHFYNFFDKKQSMFKKIISFIEIVRPSVVMLAGLFTLLGNLLSGGISIISIVSAMLLCGAGNVINDIMDYEIDKINRPERPLPSGRMTMSQAKKIY